MNTVMNVLLEYAVNEYELTKDELEKGLKKNHIPFAESAAGNTKIYNFAEDAIAYEYIVTIKDSKITAIYEILSDDEIKFYYEHEHKDLYQLFFLTLFDMAKENCEISYESLKNTLYAMNGIEFSTTKSFNGEKRLLKIGVVESVRWQFGLRVEFTTESLVKILSIQDYSRKVYLYGEHGDINE